MSNKIPTESGAGVIAGQGEAFTVNFRTGIGEIKPEAKELEGITYIFREGWVIDSEDIKKFGVPEFYLGEIAMVPNDFEYPADAPVWIASGDLTKVENEHG